MNLVVKIDTPGLHAALQTVCDVVADAGGVALLVGGCVRDFALDISAKDLDIEVYGIEPKRLLEILKERFKVDLVGQAFGVIKIQGHPIDVSIPRRESKAGLGHKGFEIFSDPDMSPAEAASRRDFTMNAIAFDPRRGKIIDPYNGLRDLEHRLLRHTTEKFSEDPLRVLRGMQFAARFDLSVAPETVALCQNIEPEGLAVERIFEEWKKLILYGRKPSRGLTFLQDSGWLRYFPELEAFVGCQQDPIWHPEGDVWIHTLHCLDVFAGERTGDPWEDLVVGFAVLCHDLGKPATTKFEDGRFRSKGHDIAGEAPTRLFLGRLTRQQELIDEVVPLVIAHLRPVDLFNSQAGHSAIRRLARRVKRIDRLVRVAKADQLGRPPIAMDQFPAGDWLLEQAGLLGVESSDVKPLVMGRHLIELGLLPGPQFGRILNACFEAQLDGKFSTVEDGVAYAGTVIAGTVDG